MQKMAPKKQVGTSRNRFQLAKVKMCLLDPRALKFVLDGLKIHNITQGVIDDDMRSLKILCTLLIGAEDLVENTRRDTGMREKELKKIRDMRRKLEQELYP